MRLLPLLDYLSLIIKPRVGSGTVLPAREYALDFNIVDPVKNAPKPKHSLFTFLKILKKLKDDPVLLLSTVAEHLRTLNRYNIDCPGRLRHLDIACRYSYTAIQEVYVDFYFNEELPESEKRRYALVSTIEAIRELSIGYKLVFKHYYTLPDKLFLALQNRTQLFAFKVIELSYMEQYLSVLRYQKFPEQSWRDCNQLFFALEKIHLIDKKFLFSGCLHKLAQRSAGYKDNNDPKHASIRQVFIVLHLMGLMDVISWPFPLLNKMENYIFYESKKVKLELDKRLPLKTGELIIYQQQICPPLYERIDTSGQAAFIFDISDFENRLREKYDQIITEKLQNDVSERFSIDLSLDMYDEQHLVDKILNKLHFFSRIEPRKNINKFSELSVFFGFNECFQFVHDLVSAETGLLDNEKSSMQKSSTLVTDNSIIDNKQWYIINESKGGVHLRLQECESMPTMFIGQLVIFNFNKDIGYVSRIHRRKSQDVEITIIKIATQGRGVTIQDERIKAQGQMIPCILAKKQSGEEILLIYCKQHIYLDSNLYINCQNETKSLKLGKKCLKLPEIVAFDLRAD